MRFLVLSMLALAAWLCAPHPARAQINECIGAHGERVYTDQPCAAGASVAANSGSAQSGDDADLGYLNTSCPGSPQALRERVASAFDNDDPNVLAGVLVWSGVDHGTASSRMRQFKRWLKQPLVGVNFSGAAAPPLQADAGDKADEAASNDQAFSYAPPTDDAGMGYPQPGDADYAPRRPQGLTVLTQPRGGDGYGAPSARNFGMTERGNCWWLTF